MDTKERIELRNLRKDLVLKFKYIMTKAYPQEEFILRMMTLKHYLNILFKMNNIKNHPYHRDTYKIRYY